MPLLQFTRPPAWFGGGWCPPPWHRTAFSIHTEIWWGEEGIFTRGEERLADLSVGGALIQGDGTTTGGIRNIRSPHSL